MFNKAVCTPSRDKNKSYFSVEQEPQCIVRSRGLRKSAEVKVLIREACLRHPDCDTARENRDTVFLQMRRSMDVIHFVVKEGVIPELAGTTSNGEPRRNHGAHRRSRAHHYNHTGTHRAEEMEPCLTVCNAIKKFEVSYIYFNFQGLTLIIYSRAYKIDYLP
ncbi:alpha-catulin [Trichonephila clavipes]|nr:alpha-catulin [Trichonephila clavipes]